MRDADRELLRFEAQWWPSSAKKERAIRARFHLSPTRYYQRLNQLLDDPQALEVEPVIVHRLLRLRDAS